MPQQQQNTQVGPRKYVAFNEFEGMDTQSNRVDLPKKRLAWCENLQPIGGNQLILIPGALFVQFTTTSPVVRAFYAFIGDSPGFNPVDVLILFMQDGSAQQINFLTNTGLTFAPPGTFSGPTDCAQWKDERILIADPKFGYGSWDTHSLTGPTPGGGVTIDPNITITAGGSGYTSPPAVTASGGSPNATLQAAISNGVVVGIIVLSGGSYNPGAAITINFSGGGGTGAAATAVTFPLTIIAAPTSVAVFSGRAWLAGGRQLSWSGTTGWDDVNPANAAGSTALTDSDLIHKITALRALNNYLYIFGDNAIKQIGSVTVVTSTTQFTLVTLSSDQGTTFPMTIRSYNRLVIFANNVGVYAIFGASVEKVSDFMDGVFRQILFSAQELSASVMDLRNIHTYMLLARITDPFTGLPRSIIMMLQGKKWWVASQGDTLSVIVSAVPNGQYIPYGVVNGAQVGTMFTNNVTGESFLLKTALSSEGQPQRSKRLLRSMTVQENSFSTANVTLTCETENGGVGVFYLPTAPLVWTNNSLVTVAWQNNSLIAITWGGGNVFVDPEQAQATGIYIGATVSGAATNLTLSSIVLEYEDGTLMRSRNTS